jgi:hypothetical protein
MWGKHPFWILDNCVIEVRNLETNFGNGCMGSNVPKVRTDRATRTQSDPTILDDLEAANDKPEN